MQSLCLENYLTKWASFALIVNFWRTVRQWWDLKVMLNTRTTLYRLFVDFLKSPLFVLSMLREKILMRRRRLFRRSRELETKWKIFFLLMQYVSHACASANELNPSHQTFPSQHGFYKNRLRRRSSLKVDVFTLKARSSLMERSKNNQKRCPCSSQLHGFVNYYIMVHPIIMWRRK